MLDVPPHPVPRAHLSQDADFHTAVRPLQFSTPSRSKQHILGRVIEGLASLLNLIDDSLNRGPHVVALLESEDERVENIAHIQVLLDRIEVTGDPHDPMRVAQEGLVQRTAVFPVQFVFIQPRGSCHQYLHFEMKWGPRKKGRTAMYGETHEASLKMGGM